MSVLLRSESRKYKKTFQISSQMYQKLKKPYFSYMRYRQYSKKRSTTPSLFCYSRHHNTRNFQGYFFLMKIENIESKKIPSFIRLEEPKNVREVLESWTMYRKVWQKAIDIVSQNVLDQNITLAEMYLWQCCIKMLQNCQELTMKLPRNYQVISLKIPRNYEKLPRICQAWYHIENYQF